MCALEKSRFRGMRIGVLFTAGALVAAMAAGCGSSSPSSSGASSPAAGASSSTSAASGDFSSLATPSALALWRGNATRPPAGDKWTIAVVPKSVGLFYWGTVEAGADAAGKYFGVTIDWKGTSTETDETGQVNILQDFITEHVNGIAFAAIDAHGLVPTADSAKAAGIPVVNIDSGLSPQTPPLVATDNIHAGAQAAEILASQIGDKGDVALLPFVPSAETSIQRQQGFVDELKKFPNIHLVETQYDQSDENTALSETQNIMIAHPNLAGIFAENEPGVLGAAEALKQAGDSGKVKLIGFDNASDEVADLASGLIQALIVQNPYRIGYQGVAEVVSLLEHKTVPANVDTGAIIATKANMNQPSIHAMLYPPAMG